MRENSARVLKATSTMWTASHLTLLLPLILGLVTDGACNTPPGKPKITSCRSPERETFTCWWEPESDGGLPTTYRLYYRKEDNSTIYECPDYQTAGANSCFFNRQATSIWVVYNFTVVATNDLGSNTSDFLEVDVGDIVQPNVPENVTTEVHTTKRPPYLEVMWKPPSEADTRSGWMVLNYEVRIKLEKEREWLIYLAGQQKKLDLFGLYPGGVYMVEVRCRTKPGLWSNWSETAYVTLPNFLPTDRYTWILISIFSVFILFILIWTLSIQRASLKRYFLPPVPGPKIKGFDTQLLKSGKSEDVFVALVIKEFPPTFDYSDLLVEYLEVYDNEEQVFATEGTDLNKGCSKSKTVLDSDSGRGSCDSHTLLLEKCGEPGDEQPAREGWVSGQGGSHRALGAQSPDSAGGQSQIWPTVFSPESRPSTDHAALGALGAAWGSPGHWPDYEVNTFCPDKLPSGYGNFAFPERSVEPGAAPASPSRLLEYVEVQKVNQGNVLVLKPIGEQVNRACGDDAGPYHPKFTGQDYSKVNGVTNDSVLLLQRELNAQCLGDCPEEEKKEEEGPEEGCLEPQASKLAMNTSTIALQEGMRLTSSGYVDTIAMSPT